MHHARRRHIEAALNRLLPSLACVCLSFAGCGKGETPAPAADQAAPAAAKPTADAPDKAVALYHEGLRGDFDKMWAVSTDKGRKEISAMVENLKKGSADELKVFGLTADEATKLDVKGFFGKVMGQRSEAEKTRDSRPLSDVKVEPVANDKTKATYKMGPAHCEAELVKESDGWKVDGHSCEEGG